jgi:hypothetical protein
VVDDDEAGDRREILDWVVVQLGVEARIDGEGHLRPDEQHRAVVRRLGDILRGELIVGPGSVLDDHLLAPAFGEMLGQGAAERIRHPAGRRRHDDGDGLGGVAGLRCNRCGAKHQETGQSADCGRKCAKHRAKRFRHVGAPSTVELFFIGSSIVHFAATSQSASFA